MTAPAQTTGSQGFTLMEVIIALVIATMLVGVTLPAVSAISTARRDSAAKELVGTIRYLFDRAQLDHLYIRLNLDMDSASYQAEEANNPVMLLKAKLEVKEGKVEEPEEEEEILSAEEEEEELFGSTMASLFTDQFEWQGWYSYKDKLKKKTVDFQQYTDEIIEKTNLPTGVKIAGVYTAGLEEVATAGSYGINFFPNGWVEPAIIYLKDEDEETVFSLRIEPLTGTATVVEGEVEPPDFAQEAKDEDEKW